MQSRPPDVAILEQPEIDAVRHVDGDADQFPSILPNAPQLLGPIERALCFHHREVAEEPGLGRR